MNELIELLTICKAICGTEAKFYSRFKTGVHSAMPSKFVTLDNALDKAIAALSAKPEPVVCRQCKGARRINHGAHMLGDAHVDNLRLVCDRCFGKGVEPAKLPEVDRDGFISRNACDAGDISRYARVIAVDDFCYYITKLTAAHADEMAQSRMEAAAETAQRLTKDIAAGYALAEAKGRREALQEISSTKKGETK